MMRSRCGVDTVSDDVTTASLSFSRSARTSVGVLSPVLPTGSTGVVGGTGGTGGSEGVGADLPID